MLKDRWRAQPVTAPAVVDAMPKRPSQPLVPGTPLKTTAVVDTSWRKPPVSPPLDTSKKSISKILSPEEPAPEPPSKSSILLYLPFFGQSVSLLLPFETKILPAMPLTSSRIAQWWELMSKERNSMLQTMALRKAADELKLKGWPVFQLVKTYVEQIPLSDTHQRMLAWYYLNRLGYDAKLGIDGTGAAILMATTDAEIFGLTFYQENSSGRRYYFLMRNESLPGNRFLTYKPANYDIAARPLELTDINFDLKDKNPSFVHRSFTFRGVEQKYLFEFGRNRMNMLATWPQSAFRVYAKPDQRLLPLVDFVRKSCSTLSAREKADFLLALVQNSLAYQDDVTQFGTQRHLFPEETLVMPFSDCEDRSFLFATLMKMAFNFELILTDYPGHVATAVQLGQPKSDDDVIVWKGRNWIICDPTYMNASSGMSMPDFKSVTPEVISLQ